MTSPVIDFPVFDADNHMYETTDAFTKYLPARVRRPGAVRRGQRAHQDRPQGPDQRVHPQPDLLGGGGPGAQEEYFRSGNPEGKSRREIMGKPIRSLPAFIEPGPRLELMDELGLDRALMWPTLASLLEERLRGDPSPPTPWCTPSTSGWPSTGPSTSRTGSFPPR